MIRDSARDKEYFDRCVTFVQEEAITPRKTSIALLPVPAGRAGRATDLVGYATRLCIMRYGRGDAITDMRDSVSQMLEMLELKQATLASVRLEPDVRKMYERLDLGILYESLALLAFMVALRMPASDILHALELIGHPGEDAILDHVAHRFGDASRNPAAQSKFPKVYGPLTEVIVAPAEQRAAKLNKFVEGWYKRMKPIYWHDNHQGADGAYFGYWCFEAALTAMVFAIDDAGIVNHPHYPSDLVRHYRNTA